jgi:hypothetical protein
MVVLVGRVETLLDGLDLGLHAPSHGRWQQRLLWRLTLEIIGQGVGYQYRTVLALQSCDGQNSWQTRSSPSGCRTWFSVLKCVAFTLEHSVTELNWIDGFYLHSVDSSVVVFLYVFCMPRGDDFRVQLQQASRLDCKSCLTASLF